jgi:hypothetical protein
MHELWNTAFVQKTCIAIQNNSQHSLEPERSRFIFSLPYSQRLATCIYPEIDKPNPRCTILFFKAHFTIILTYFPGSVYNKC